MSKVCYNFIRQTDRQTRVILPFVFFAYVISKKLKVVRQRVFARCQATFCFKTLKN